MTRRQLLVVLALVGGCTYTEHPVITHSDQPPPATTSTTEPVMTGGFTTPPVVVDIEPIVPPGGDQ